MVGITIMVGTRTTSNASFTKCGDHADIRPIAASRQRHEIGGVGFWIPQTCEYQKYMVKKQILGSKELGSKFKFKHLFHHVPKHSKIPCLLNLSQQYFCCCLPIAMPQRKVELLDFETA